MLKINKKDILFIAFTILYKIILQTIFMSIIYPIYFNTSLRLEKNNSYYFLGWIMIILGSYWASKELSKKKMSSNIMVLLFLFAFVPSLILAGVIYTKFFFEIILYFFVLLFVYYVVPDFSFKRPRKIFLKPAIYIGISILSIVIVYIWYKYAGHRLTLDVSDIYVVRAEASLNNMPTVFRYIYISAKNFLPLVIVYFLHQKKIFLFIWTILLQYMVFLYDGSKTTIATFLLSVLCYIGYKYIKNFEHFYPLFTTGLCFVSYLEHIFVGSINIIHYFIRRTIIVPAAIHYYYFDFFSENQFDFFKGTILRRIGFESVYSDIGIPKTIGKIYAGTIDNSMNNGLFSDAFSNMGYIGIVVMPILIVLVIKIFQAVSYDLPLYIPASCLFMIIFTIISNSYWSYFITHGFIFMIIILYLWPRENNITTIGEESKVCTKIKSY